MLPGHLSELRSAVDVRDPSQQGLKHRRCHDRCMSSRRVDESVSITTRIETFSLRGMYQPATCRRVRDPSQQGLKHRTPSIGRTADRLSTSP